MEMLSNRFKMKDNIVLRDISTENEGERRNLSL